MEEPPNGLALSGEPRVSTVATWPFARRGSGGARWLQPNNDLATGERGGALMKFYAQQHRYYCRIDLDARSMYVCILPTTRPRKNSRMPCQISRRFTLCASMSHRRRGMMARGRRGNQQRERCFHLRASLHASGGRP